MILLQIQTSSNPTTSIAVSQIAFNTGNSISIQAVTVTYATASFLLGKQFRIQSLND